MLGQLEERIVPVEKAVQGERNPCGEDDAESRPACLQAARGKEIDIHRRKKQKEDREDEVFSLHACGPLLP